VCYDLEAKTSLKISAKIYLWGGDWACPKSMLMQQAKIKVSGEFTYHSCKVNFAA
jgi:hypothetical protein